MSSLNNIYWYVMLKSGPACICEIHNDVYRITSLQDQRTLYLADPTFVSPIFKSFAEFKLAYPEEFI